MSTTTTTTTDQKVKSSSFHEVRVSTVVPPADNSSHSHRNPISFLTLSWLTPLMNKISKLPKDESFDTLQLPPLWPEDTSLAQEDLFVPYWSQLRLHHAATQPGSSTTAADPGPPRLLQALIRGFWRYFVALLLLGLLSTLLNLALPLMIPQILYVLDAADNPKPSFLLTTNAYALAVIVFAIQCVCIAINTTNMSIWRTAAMRQRAALFHAIFVKSLRLSAKSQKEFGPGKINSLFSTDVGDFQTIYKDAAECIISLIKIVLALLLLTSYLGNVTWIALALYAGLFSVQFAAAPLLNQSSRGYFMAADRRTKVLREFLYGIKNVKFQAIEDYFHKAMLKERAIQQQNQIKGSAGYFCIYVASGLQKKILPSVAIIIYIAMGRDYNASMIFTTLGLFGSLIEPASNISNSISTLLRFKVSYDRLSSFFLARERVDAELTSRHVQERESGTGCSIVLEDATYSWESEVADASVKPVAGDAAETGSLNQDTIFELRNLTLSVAKGKLVAVVGSVGSGKSALLSALSGQMRMTGGQGSVYGTLAYCPQEPWIVSGTIEENILLNSDTITRDVVDRAVTAVCLDADVAKMSSHLGTQIGERGVSLSGGQRARVALARAIARDADIYLLDDPMASLDAHVGKKVFERAICGALRSKTVLLVTHQLHLLSKADVIVVLDHGRLVESGSFANLMSRADGKLTHMMRDYNVDADEKPSSENATEGADGEQADVSTGSEEPVQEVGVKKKEEKQKEVAEERAQGGMTLATFKSYFDAGSHMFLPTMILLQFVAIAASCGPRIFLYIWIGNQKGTDPDHNLKLFGGLSAIDGVILVISLIVVNTGAYFSSKEFHDRPLASLIRFPMNFFDTQPIGRVLNRMTGDVMNIDFMMTGLLVNLTEIVTTLMMNAVIVSYTTPISLAFLAVIGILATFIYPKYKRSYIELKRINSVLNSPLNSHVSESLNGIPTILAHDAVPLFVSKGHYLCDRSNAATLYSVSCNIWLTLRLEAMTSVLLLLLVLLASGGVISPVAVALGFGSAVDLGTSFNSLLIFLGLIEGSFNAVERLNYYANDLPVEAPETLPNDPKDGTWPSRGAVQIRNLELRYEARPDHPVITDLSLNVRPGEKLGIVGTTGSGKSTLMAALFRIMDATKGSIEIDDIDIATLGLRVLRSGLQIIPQEPILFNGTFRTNLDLHSMHEDGNLWAALEDVGLKSHVSSQKPGLDGPVTENGNNLSFGQRQLLCLARALLAKPRILVMDEATASVDADADRIIQDCIATRLADTTVISIAHRINTVAAFDRVMVLNHGRIAEIGAPHDLLSRPNGGLFADLVDATGGSNAEAIRAVAKALSWEGATAAAALLTPGAHSP
ncbi:Multidrug resistance-associated protein 9 [Geranomyces variabilis]|nr:Multidrug resistance-associated protein 9 [Geranomyces variabilis]